MILLFVSFFSSLLLILGIIRYKHLHEHFSGDHDLSGPQKFHEGSIPRIGGLGIYAALWIANLVAYLKDPALGVFLSLILIAAFPVSATGLAEDITKRIGVKDRYGYEISRAQWLRWLGFNNLQLHTKPTLVLRQSGAICLPGPGTLTHGG